MTLATDIETKADLRLAILRQLDTEKYVHKEALAQRLGLTSEKEKRQMRLEIVLMRRNGVPVVGSQKGYKLATTIEEIQVAIDYIDSYIVDLGIVKEDYKNLLKKFNGQMKMRLGE